MNEHVTEQHYARLARHRDAGWDIDSRRDGFPLFSALKREATAITYVVTATIPGLVRRLDEIEAGREQVIAEAARRAAAGARERAERSAESPQKSAESPRDTDQA